MTALLIIVGALIAVATVGLVIASNRVVVPEWLDTTAGPHDPGGDQT